jgi:hypothetical protein
MWWMWLRNRAKHIGEHALDVIKKYDTIVMGRLYCFRCTCGHDFHLKDGPIKKTYTYKNDLNKVAEI